MQLSRPLLLLLLALPATPAAASCTVGLGTAGVLSLQTGATTILTSEAGVASVIALTNVTGILNATVTLSNPRLDAYPAGFNPAGATVEQNYSAVWLLGSTNNPTFTSGSRSFTAPIGLLITITLNNRITAPGGFKQGAYTTKTTVECS